MQEVIPSLGCKEWVTLQMPGITTDRKGLMLLPWDLLSVMGNHLPLDLTQDSFKNYEQKKGERSKPEKDKDTLRY